MSGSIFIGYRRSDAGALMNYSTGKLSFIFMVAVLLSFAGAWWVARRYRVAMRKLMSAPLATPTPAPTPGRPPVSRVAEPGLAPLPEPAPVTAGDNRLAGYRLALLLVALSSLISLSSAALELHVVMAEKTFSFNRLAVLGFVQLWPVIPSLGLLWRWSRGRVLGALALWFVVCFAVLIWLLAWWPLKRLGRALARAYARKWLSELMVLFTAVWGISLLAKALMAASDLGLGGAVMLLPLLWVPVMMAIARHLGRPRGRPPTLLVLRVFQHDERIQALFDHVIERWRLTGNTVLIAGTDLIERTLDADDIFTFIDGRLASRFIQSPADVAARLAAFDLAPDAEGRFRINECYCHDTTWQPALAALVQRSDVVLMDLRSFKAHNEGCRHELGVLSQAARISRVVVLTDGDTDRAAALGATEAAPDGRFVWLHTSRPDRTRRREVLESLFVTPGVGKVRACENP